ncbi:S8 family serine peptidase [Streptomyces sp. NBC_00825]|uniref:S8 family serine peptidase n=1 Tax=unclassified Streptomyces TaxID=2593676 RepID=UPI002259B42F|nr:MULTISPECIES: S8 family serine peptidase [unclassified Streptomyces]WTB58419.1 S8 family serine peptidase [Streptomyces sp. NBC_00826]WTH88701.1 S8 family serine peptidase [Streptomyces sp. NBC_00825]WTH97431.1 S8 family serine peptidase [Streptomyces sp. NBC_00822]MCX4862946.1 S8 family serine peptidase [Streptomyces sp. NBC_00906]MCX4894183.1 S8 family serine peptidase [Streptomyces sp. NBC_00892]
MRRTRWMAFCATALAAALAGGTLPAAADDTPAFAAPSAPPATAGRGGTVTLLTGDVVTYSGHGNGVQISSIVPGTGRDGMGFTRFRAGGHEYAVPIDAVGQIAGDRVDRRLFDVTELAASGYADADTDSLRILVGGATESSPSPRAPKGARVAAAFPTARTSALDVPKKSAGTVWEQIGTPSRARARGIGKVWLDGRVRATLDRSVPQIGADRAHRAGVTGKGTKVAVLDTGYDRNHPDLKNAVVASQDFTGDGDVQDMQGHGTHVSSIIAGSGAASAGRYAGVAPGAELVEGKVLDNDGYGYDSWILAGMQWAVDQDAGVVNMSLGQTAASDGTDPLSAAVDRLSAEHGTLFVIAAGNSGDHTISAPGAADAALTVGSVTKSGAMSPFSSRGPREGRPAVKPEISGPGSDIVAARAAGTLDDAAVTEQYASLSGTSMAAPHVAGAAALLAQRHPDWSGARLKAALIGSAARVDGATVSDTGSGLTDVPAALATAVLAEPATLAAEATYPNSSAEPQRRELTWTNTSDRPLRLTLSAGQGGAVRIGARTLTVPARSSAVSKVTLEPSEVEAGTTYGGAVTATWPGHGRATVPVSIKADPQTYTLTLTGPAPRAGSEATTTGVVLQNERTGTSQLIGLTGTTPKKVTLPRGSYRALGHTWEYDTVDGTVVGTTAIHFARRATVDRDTSLALDTGGARPVRIGVDDGSARIALQSATGIASHIDTGSATADTGLVAPSSAGQYRVEAVPSTGGTLDGLTFFGGLSWQQREVDGHEPGSSPQALKLLLSQYSIYSWLGTATGEVVDIGTGADTDPASMDLKGRIVLWTPASSDTSFNNALYQKLTDAGTAAIMYVGYGLSVYRPTPILRLDESGVPTLRDRLAQGPLTLTLNGVGTGADAYYLHHSVDGRIPAGADWFDRRSELAEVRTTQRTHGYPSDPKDMYAWTTWHGLTLFQQTTRYRPPAEQTLHFSPGVEWTTATFHYQYDIGDRVYPLGTLVGAPTVYRAGGDYRDDWMSAPFNPALGRQAGAAQVVREGDKLKVALAAFSDAAGHRAETAPGADSGSTVLTDDSGKVLARNAAPGRATFDLPREQGWYRLTVDATRTSPDPVTWMLGTRVTSEWRLRSGHERSAAPARLLDLDYRLPLTGENAADPGKPLGYTVGLTAQGERKALPIASLKVWYATDGTDWKPASAARGTDGRWKVTVPALGTAKVDLRSTVTDASGASLTETLTDAYNSGCADIWCSQR